MVNTLFSTYSQGENRVTASILAVFERISFSLVERILQTLCQETEVTLLEFRNQPAGDSSVPDAIIKASFAYWIETKIVPDSVRIDQIKRHLKALDSQTSIANQRLLVLTPDIEMPDVLGKIDDERLAWANFESLIDVISSLVTRDEEWFVSEAPLPTEREQELLRELVRFLISEGLGETEKQTLVVAARRALPEYQKYDVYICQPERSFQKCTHMAFYANGKIYRFIPQITGAIESIHISEEGIEDTNVPEETRQYLHQLVQHLKADNNRNYGDERKIIFLTKTTDPETIQLPADIENNLTAETGRHIAFVQGHRYIPVERFKQNPIRTSELLD